MVSCCWNGPLGGQLGWQQMWARDDKYKKCLEKKNKEQKEREVLARWMERTQPRAREGGDIQACWMFLMSSLGIHLLKETSLCHRPSISPGALLRCCGKREKTAGREKPFVPCRSRELNETQPRPVCKDLFFREGRGALWLYIIFVSPR